MGRPSAATIWFWGGRTLTASARANMGADFLVSPLSPPRFVNDVSALTAVLDGIKLVACPHCHQTGP